MNAAQITYVKTEGGLLPVDLLERVRGFDAELGGLRPEDYGLAPGERINDAIVRSWTRLSGLWRSFAEHVDSAPESETTLQTQTRTRWLVPLLDELGFGRIEAAPAVTFEGDQKSYPVSHRSNGVVLHLVGARVELDRRGPAGTRPAHGMLQEFLNRSPDHLWALTTNGRRLRILRDSSSLTRQAFCEFDLEAMFEGQEYSDWALCWLVCHASRFIGEPQAACWLEQWSAKADTDGTRALEQLRVGVEKAIESLGTGFLIHPANGELRRKLTAGELSVTDYNRQLLRLVYRLIFLLVAEARGLLHPGDADPGAVRRYRDWYSVSRLPELARLRPGGRHGDLWEGLQVTFAALAGAGQPALGLGGLGSALWSPDSVADLAGVGIANRALLDAVFHLSTVDNATGSGRRSPRRAVNYANLGAEELGSVYESLLELHPKVEGRRFSLEVAAGSERKTTGSYYTPTPLINELLETALAPVIDEAAGSEDPEAALLRLRVLDPAVGSGHFLIAAAHRIAHRLAAVRSGENEPSPEDLRSALREVISNCVYGIDVNPMAVELCKVSLWMEATEPGMPLGFLDHRIVCGNSLLGATPALLARGLPNEAFKALGDDDKKWITLLKKRNKAELKIRQGQGALDFGGGLEADAAAMAAAIAAIDEMPDGTAAQVAAKEAAYQALAESEHAERARFAADAWCAAFVAPKTPDSPVLTDEVVRMCATDPARVPADVHETVVAMREEYGFLHLHVAFPDVFTVPDDPEMADNQPCGWSGGFDVVLGNPPWERVKLSEKEFFAARDPEVAAAPNAAARKRMIAQLQTDAPGLFEEFEVATRNAAGQSHLLRDSGRYPLGGRGDVNTYAVFAELMANAMATTGRVGVVVPTGIATDDTTKHFFADLVDNRSLVSLFDFENRKGVFPAVDSRIKFSLLTLTGADRPCDEAEFVFFAHKVADLADPERRFTLTPEDFALLNPNTRTSPVFRSRRDAEITKGIYRRVPVLVNENEPDGNPWGFKGQLMFMMNTDSGLFRTRDELESDGWTLEGNHFVRGSDRYLPLYEGKMIHHFDHRWATYDGTEFCDVSVEEKQDPTFMAQPRYWVPGSEVRGRSPGGPLMGWRKICRSTDERTFIATATTAVGAGDNLLLYWTDVEAESPYPVMCSHVFDFVARQKLGGSNFQYYIAKQLPLLSPLGASGHGMLLLELTYTAWDLAGFARDLGHDGPPFRWDPDRRALLRAELDALMFRLYGIERDDVDYIMDTFPIVRRNDEKAFGEFRTKRLILERFDAMEEADSAGKEYVTALDPPPADPSLCHPESTRPSWAK